MQDELEASHPDLDIHILGVNERGQEIGNGFVTDGRDIPWLQDVDSDNDGLSDVWRNSWSVEYRDVVILDQNNEKVGAFNLTIHDLADQDNYDTLRQMLIDTAMAAEEPVLVAGDANGDYQFDQLDLFEVLRAGKFNTQEPATWAEGDWNGDHVFDRLDILAALQAGQYLQGPYASTSGVDDDPGALAKSEPLVSDVIVAGSLGEDVLPSL